MKAKFKTNIQQNKQDLREEFFFFFVGQEVDKIRYAFDRMIVAYRQVPV